jgi:hypothetical protein
MDERIPGLEIARWSFGKVPEWGPDYLEKEIPTMAAANIHQHG